MLRVVRSPTTALLAKQASVTATAAGATVAATDGASRRQAYHAPAAFRSSSSSSSPSHSLSQRNSRNNRTAPLFTLSSFQKQQQQQHFHTTAPRNAIIEYKLADIGEGIVECQVLQWYVKEGDYVNEFDKVCEVSSDKAVVDISSRFSGKITKLYYNVNDMAKVGRPLVQIDTGSDGAAAPAETKPAETKASELAAPAAPAADAPIAAMENASSGSTLATPAVRHLAKQHSISLASVRGTGKGGRIMKEDILNYINNKQAAPSAPSPSEPAKPIAVGAKDRREPITGFKKVMVKTMNDAWRRVPHFGLCDEVNVDSLVRLRNELKAVAAASNVKLTYMPFFIKAASLTLKEFPILNSSVSNDESEVIYKASHNIGIAMDTPNGLIVPNIKDCQDKSILEIAKELNRLQDLGQKGQLGPADLTGGTFTFSNIGNMGGTYASPIIVVPEVCIGAIGQTKKVPSFTEDGQVVPVHLMNISWSADHRIIDGATMVRFSNKWKTFLQQPGSLLLHMK